MTIPLIIDIFQDKNQGYLLLYYLLSESYGLHQQFLGLLNVPLHAVSDGRIAQHIYLATEVIIVYFLLQSKASMA